MRCTEVISVHFLDDGRASDLVVISSLLCVERSSRACCIPSMSDSTTVSSIKCQILLLTCDMRQSTSEPCTRIVERVVVDAHLPLAPHPLPLNLTLTRAIANYSHQFKIRHGTALKLEHRCCRWERENWPVITSRDFFVSLYSYIIDLYNVRQHFDETLSVVWIFRHWISLKKYKIESIRQTTYRLSFGLIRHNFLA